MQKSNKNTKLFYLANIYASNKLHFYYKLNNIHDTKVKNDYVHQNLNSAQWTAQLLTSAHCPLYVNI